MEASASPATALLALAWAGLELRRPWALWLLLVPVLLLVLSRRPTVPPTVATGTLRIWRTVAERVATTSGRSRRRVPAWLLAACGALVLGMLALAEPAPSVRELPREWRVVVDRGVGMALPWRDPGGERPGAVRTRGEVALERVRTHLTGVAGADDRVRWIAVGRAPLLLAPGTLPPGAWSRPARTAAGGTPRWARFDEPGVLWVTDRRPVAPRASATLVTSGGGAVPGAIAAAGDELIGWAPDGDPPRGVRLPGVVLLTRAPFAVRAEGPPLPPLLEAFLRAWAGSRGLGAVQLHASPPAADLERVVLVVEGVGALREDATDTLEPFRVREPGLLLSGLAVRSSELQATWPGPPAEGPLQVRWRGASGASLGAPLVSSAAGWVRVHIAALDTPGGDPAGFALRLAALLDEALLPPPGVVHADARAAAGTGATLVGAPAPVVRTPSASGTGALPSSLAAAAALAAFVAVLLRRVPAPSG